MKRLIVGVALVAALAILSLFACAPPADSPIYTYNNGYDAGYSAGITAGQTMCVIPPEVIQQYKDLGRAEALKEQVNCLHDPTASELAAFLVADNTNSIGLDVCGDFAAMLTHRAKQQGIWARTVVINYSNSSRSHALNMFCVKQSDGKITETYVEPQTDWIVKVAIGYDYMQNWRDRDHEPAGTDIIGQIFIFE